MIVTVSGKDLYPIAQEKSPPIPESELPDSAATRCKAWPASRKSPRGPVLCDGAFLQVDKGWLDCPYGPSPRAVVSIDEALLRRNPALLFGMAQGTNLREVGDHRGFSTFRAAKVSSQIYPPALDLLWLNVRIGHWNSPKLIAERLIKSSIWFRTRGDSPQLPSGIRTSYSPSGLAALQQCRGGASL